jgi:hypothetical protein
MDWSVPRAEHKGGNDDDSDGIFGPIRLGPLVGVGIPNVLNFGGTLKLTRYLGGGINVGLIPAIKVSLYGEAVLSYQEYDVYGRIYPFGGGFYLGAGAGYETVKGTITDSIDASALANEYPEFDIPELIEYESRGRVRTMILTPQVGYLYITRIGFSLGFYLGVQFPIAPSDIDFETTVEGLPEVAIEQYVAPLDRKVRDTLETVGRSPLPTLGVQIGWLL